MGYLGRSPTPSPIDSSDIPDNSIDASKIIDGAIAVADVADNAITEDKIAVAAVVSLKSGRKNLLINGGFDVWQRGTSFTLTTSGYHTDRFRGRDGTFSRSTDVPPGEGFAYSVFYDNDGTRASINMRQVIENGKRLTDGKELTLSFWAKGSVNTTCSVDFGDTQNTTWNLTTSWNRVVVSVPAHADRNHNNLFSGGLFVDFNFYNNYPDIYITGIQLELGSVATDFEHRSYGEELALCQRYYSVLDEGRILVINNGSGTGIIGSLALPQPMRAFPTLTKQGAGSSSGSFSVYSGGSGTQVSHVSPASAVNVGIASKYMTALNISSMSTFPDGYTGWADLSSSQLKLFFDAEL